MYQPARVDIGIRGHMPFDDHLKMNRKAGSPAGKKRSVIIESTRIRNKSELGIHRSIFSTKTSIDARKRSESPPSDDDYTAKVDSKSYLGTQLLKNFNPRLPPKNLG